MSRDGRRVRHRAAVPLLLSSSLLECSLWAIDPVGEAGGLLLPPRFPQSHPTQREADALGQSGGKTPTHREKARRSEILLHNEI